MQPLILVNAVTSENIQLAYLEDVCVNKNKKVMNNSLFMGFNAENTHNRCLYTAYRIYITKVAVNKNLND